ncbi:heterokaryon incompatibility protein-domain-containing protein [Podospora didyma]|uniref:Heterokaryon incompatibility protein-domain-containing protein n=1 Tax=Podospora didyma TaxID=330526 RepID=A0AAE0P7X8_9PEZI|nr:heterokaryon incompatibility protein-domain-containing protein [Podospora didyma]
MVASTKKTRSSQGRKRGQKQQRDAATRRPRQPRKGIPYKYQPLNPSRHEIRLLEIAPGRPGSRVSCRMFPVSLTSSPPAEFDALSYVWGPPRPSYTITLGDDKAFVVGRNLRKALDDLRLPDQPRVLWCDALCINQQDDYEKGFQIQLMRRIYTEARAVRAWIDIGLGLLTGVFEDLSQLAERGGMELADVHDHEYWYPVADIFRAPYWRRIWIQQELILARQVVVHCRRQVLDGEHLFEFQRQAFNSYNSFKDLEHSNATSAVLQYINRDTGSTGVVLYGGGIKRARKLREKANRLLAAAAAADKEDYKQKDDLPASTVNLWLVQLFIQSRYLGVTHPLDRVYGLLGLAADYSEGDIAVDYSLSSTQVYTSIFQHFIKTHDSLVFLCSGEKDSLENTFVGVSVPSWLPSTGINWVNAGRGISQACGAFRAAEGARIDPHTGTLHAQGIQVDRISMAEDATVMQSLPIPDAFSWIERFCRDLWPEATDQTLLHERDEVTDILFPWVGKEFYRRFLHGTTASNRPSPEERLEAIRAVQRAAKLVEDDGQHFSLRRIILGGYTPSDVLSQAERSQALQINGSLTQRMLVGTEKGRIGSMMLPKLAKPGDEIWVFLGCPMPIVMRKTSEKRYFHVGFVVIPCLMNGEAMEGVSDGDIVEVAID